MKLLYFAWVRQRVGISEENIDLPAGVATVQQLIAWLIARGSNYAEAFKEPKRIRVAVNQDHVGTAHPVNQQDEVAFFPPVTGGRA